MARPPNPELTHQQRRVLELMARGRTNAEIAEALGVTLDGAKYHVREVFDKLGVSSREEAVASWRAGMPSLSQRLRGWLWPVGAVLAGVGGVAVAGVVVAALVVNSGSIAAHLPVVSGVGPPRQQLLMAVVESPPGSGTGTLRVFSRDASNATRSLFVKDGRFTALGWSRDGRMLAVASTDGLSGGRVRITIYDRNAWKDRSFNVQGPVNGISWSYDGAYLALVGKGVVLSKTDGTLVSKIAGKDDAGGWWSPGDDVFAATIDGSLLVVSTSGESHGLSTPPGTVPGTLDALPWANATTIRALAFRPAGKGNEISDAYEIGSSATSGWGMELAETKDTLIGAARALALLPPNKEATQGLTSDGQYGWSLQVGPPHFAAGQDWPLTLYDGAAPVARIEFRQSGPSYSIGPLALVVTSGSG